MYNLCMITAIIPARNEPYLKKTILDLLNNAKGEIEIIAVLDGYWPSTEEIVNDKKVIYIHYSTPRGMRNAINSAVEIAKGEYLLKCDAHCSFGESFDTILTADCGYNWVVIPRRFALLPDSWTIENNPKYPVDYMYLDNELHGVVWKEKNADPVLKGTLIDDVMSSQGSCWFMKKDYYKELELLDETTYGTFWNEFQEVGFKCWLSGGRVIVNKKTWYAHWHKTESRGYHIPSEEQIKAQEAVKKWLDGKGWHKQIYPVSWLVNKFKPVPTWQENQ